MRDPNGPWQDYGPRAGVRGPESSRPPGPESADDRALAPGDAVRAAAGAVAWRYRSAPLRARIAVDVTVAGLVLALILGVSLAVRPPGPDRAAAVRSTTSTVPPTAPPTTALPVTTTTTLPPTTTTTAPPPTTAPRPTTTAPRPTTTTAPPPPPSEPPPHYDTCFDALQAGALPLRAGDPGYGPHLDPDGDGRACEWRESG